MSNNRHRQPWAPADVGGRRFPGQTYQTPGSRHGNLASGRRGRLHRFKARRCASRTPGAPQGPGLCLFPLVMARAISALRSRVRRFESYWGRFRLAGHMSAELALRQIGALTGMQPDAALCGPPSRFPEHIRNGPPGPAQALPPYDHEEVAAAITVSDQILEALHSVPCLPTMRVLAMASLPRSSRPELPVLGSAGSCVAIRWP